MKLAPIVALSILLPACTNDSIDTATSGVVAEQSVTGQLSFAPGSPLPTEWETTPASGVVKLVDVTQQDAPSLDVASVTFTTHGDPISFTLSLAGAAIEPTHAYAVSAHVDTDGDGQVSAGDFITMQSFPALTNGHGSVVNVEVARVGDAAESATVSGNILLSGDAASVTYPFAGVVRVVDTSLADASSKTIASQPLTITGPGPVPFSLSVTPVDPKVSYDIQVHLDVDADGTVSEGDFITMQSYPVLTFGHGSVVDVTAQRVP